jgi:hypothetical protein
MANAFDPYREALVVETNTVWPAEFDDLPPEQRARIDESLHAKPAEATNLDYSRMHTGFCRDITVAQADLDRLK